MSDLLNKIKANPDLQGAASVLQKARLSNDSDIRSLTRQDLHELFPGHDKFKQRRTIFEMINKPKPVHALINELKAFIPYDGAAQTGNGVMADYLVILKDLKTQLNQVQEFIDAHIDLLEGRSNDQPYQEQEKGSMLGTSSSDTRGSMVNCSRQTADYSQRVQVPVEEMNRNCSRESEGMPYNQARRQGSTSGAYGHVMPCNGGPPQEPQRGHFSIPNSLERKYQWKVMYQVIVSGKTFDADKQLMNKVLTEPAQNQVQFVENQGNHEITILFCSVSSRVGTDVDAALGRVKDDKPVILVVMHHEREPKSKSVRVSPDKPHRVVLYVNVFFHDTMKGLVTCEQNKDAASQIQKKLLEFSTPIETSGNSQGAGAESGRSILSRFWPR